MHCQAGQALAKRAQLDGPVHQQQVGAAHATGAALQAAGVQRAALLGTRYTMEDASIVIDPLAPRYKEWEERAKQFQTTETVKATTLPFGGDRLGRDVLQKAIKGTEISVFVGVMAAVCATLLGVLLASGVLDPAAPKKLMPRLNQLLNRAELTTEEVHILRGMARAVGEAARGKR